MIVCRLIYRSMPSEPKKPIEQMLEALAKARRAQFGDDPKMPNPMRARLHEEIARAGAAEEENVESRGSWVTRFWPRVTVAAALATVIVLVPAIWWNRSHPLAESGDLALRDRTAGAADGLNPAVRAEDTLAKAPAASATESTVNLADNNQIKIEPAATPASEAGALASSTRVLQGHTATEFPNQVTKGFVDTEIAAAKIQAAPAAAPAAGADSKAKSDTMAGVAPPVAQSSSANSLGTKQEFSQQSAPQSYFRATGFNVSLKKTLVFEGNYAAPPAQQPATATANGRERSEQNRDRARIVGTVRVNGEAAVEVDAIAEKSEAAATKKSEK